MHDRMLTAATQGKTYCEGGMLQSATSPSPLCCLLRDILSSPLGMANLDGLDYSPIYYAAVARCLKAVDLLLQENCTLINSSGDPYNRTRSVLWGAFETSRDIQSRIVRDLETRLSRLRNLDLCHLDLNLFESISHQTFGPYTLGILESVRLDKADFIRSLFKKVRENHFTFSGHAAILDGGLLYLHPSYMVESGTGLWDMKSQGEDIEARALGIFD
jgi:hypothetical protein